MVKSCSFTHCTHGIHDINEVDIHGIHVNMKLKSMGSSFYDKTFLVLRMSNINMCGYVIRSRRNRCAISIICLLFQ